MRRRLIRIISWNIGVLLVGLLGAEGLARAMFDDQRSADFSPAEVIRSRSTEGPDVYRDEITFDGLHRRTPGQPAGRAPTVYVLGGSTVLCAEVPDDLAWPAQLQAMFNRSGRTLSVENRGKSAATISERVDALAREDGVTAGDVVVLYGGVNEAGRAFTQRDLPARVVQRFPRLGTALVRLASFSRLADAAFRQLVFGAVSTSVDAEAKATAEFRDAIRRARRDAGARGAHVVVVLQPHLFTRSRPTSYDEEMQAAFSPALGTAVGSAYASLVAMLDEEGPWIDARTALDGVDPSPFYDWHHVDGRGNAAIARFIYDHVDWDAGS